MTIPNTSNSTNAASAAAKGEVLVEPAEAPPLPGRAGQFATRGKQGRNQSPKNKTILLAGGAAVVLLLLFVLISFPTHKAKRPTPAAHQLANTQPGEAPESDKSLFPITESVPSSTKTPQSSVVGEQDIQRTATRQAPVVSPEAKLNAGGTLGSIPPFDADSGSGQAPLNQTVGHNDEPSDETHRKEHEQPSLVFIRKESSTAPNNAADRDTSEFEGLGLPTGTRLRARLEAAASTAVRTPVIAVVEYTYQKNGEIVVPAGAKALGRIEQADRSGYLSIRFASLLMPDGSSTSFDAVATDLRLRPLKGRVEGKNTGKNVLIRSLSGIGQVGAVFAGRSGSLNQPLSEGDLVRERLGTNIGESADQEIARLNITERVVVSVDANTPIYVVLDRGIKQTAARADHSPASPSQNLDSLRQLLQLQRELNQNAELTSH